jgi:hypothetical protein
MEEVHAAHVVQLTKRELEFPFQRWCQRTILSAVTMLLILGLLLQGRPALQNQGGTITGVLRSTTGIPATGVRVSALLRPETTTDLATAAAYASLAETDASGAFRLENIPPGRYYIVAGNIDVPTYYPGTVAPVDGIAIQISPGLVVSGINFTLNNVSVGRAAERLTSRGAPSWIISVQARVEGGKVPIFSEGYFPAVVLSRPDGTKIETGLNSSSVTVYETEYRVTVDHLPPSYRVKALTFGRTDLTTALLQLSSPAVSNVSSVVPVVQNISIVLERLPQTQATGVRVSGQLRGDPNRSIYVSNVPGSVYSDGSFEFLGVPPGRQAIVTRNNPDRERPLVASIVVGTRDVSNLQLEQSTIAPLTDEPRTSPVASPSNESVRLPLARIRGHVIDSTTGVPFDAGRVIVNGDQSMTFSFEAEGRFEVPKLLPGTYSLQVIAFGVGTIQKTLVLDESDVNIDFAIGPEN